MQNLWNPEDQILLKRLKKEIVPGYTLERSCPSKRFYVNTDLSKGGIGTVLLQSDDSAKAINSESQEKDNEKC